MNEKRYRILTIILLVLLIGGYWYGINSARTNTELGTEINNLGLILTDGNIRLKQITRERDGFEERYNDIAGRYKELAESVSTFNDGLGTVEDGLGTIESELGTVISGLRSDRKGLQEFAAEIRKVISEAEKIPDN